MTATMKTKVVAEEQFKPLGRVSLRVGDRGTVVGKSGRVLNPQVEPWDGILYNTITPAGASRIRVAALVLEAWDGPPKEERFVPLHVNGDSLDDRITNLKWAEPLVVRHRMVPADLTLTPERKRRILEMWEEGIPQNEIARKLRLSSNRVSQYLSREHLAIRQKSAVGCGEWVEFEELSDEVKAVVDELERANRPTAAHVIATAQRVELTDRGIVCYFNGNWERKKQDLTGRLNVRAIQLAIRTVFNLPKDAVITVEGRPAVRSQPVEVATAEPVVEEVFPVLLDDAEVEPVQPIVTEEPHQFDWERLGEPMINGNNPTIVFDTAPTIEDVLVRIGREVTLRAVKKGYYEIKAGTKRLYLGTPEQILEQIEAGL